MRILTTDFFFSIIRIATPILFATLAAVIGEKGGISNIGLEGIMMMSALFGSLSAFWSKSWLIGLLVAMAVGLLEALLMGVFAFKLKTDIILVGTAVNMIGSGGTIFLVKTITNVTMGSSLTSTTSLITKNLQIPSIHIPLIKDIPVLGKIISGHSLLTYLAFLLVWLTIVLLYKTPLGLNIRSVGENPNAASSVGVSVSKIHHHRDRRGSGRDGRCLYVHVLRDGLVFGYGGRPRLYRSGSAVHGRRGAGGLHAGGSGLWLRTGAWNQGFRDRCGFQPGSADPVSGDDHFPGHLCFEPEEKREKTI